MLRTLPEPRGSFRRRQDRYETAFRTERDFYPLVVSFLYWELKGLQAEAGAGGRRAIDFKIGKTTNPAYLELAVAPRVLGDVERGPSGTLPNKTQLYASQNKSELEKLSKAGAVKGRFLLLIDLRNAAHPAQDLRDDYTAAAKSLSGSQIVNVVYAHRSLTTPIAMKVQRPKE